LSLALSERGVRGQQIEACGRHRELGAEQLVVGDGRGNRNRVLASQQQIGLDQRSLRRTKMSFSRAKIVQPVLSLPQDLESDEGPVRVTLAIQTGLNVRQVGLYRVRLRAQVSERARCSRGKPSCVSRWPRVLVPCRKVPPSYKPPHRLTEAGFLPLAPHYARGGPPRAVPGISGGGARGASSRNGSRSHRQRHEVGNGRQYRAGARCAPGELDRGRRQADLRSSTAGHRDDPCAGD